MRIEKDTVAPGAIHLKRTRRFSWRPDVKYRKHINTALIIGPMTMVMALVGVIRNYGFYEGWILKLVGTWLTMFPIAFICASFIIPVANKLTGKIRFDDAGEKDQAAPK